MEIFEEETRIQDFVDLGESFDETADIRKVAFSCPVFGRFETEIDIIPLNSKEELGNIAIERLRDVLKQNKLDHLVSKLDTIHYHIHNLSWMDILVKCQCGDIVYLCNHPD